ncbi:MAG: hypothetical protein IKQ91_03640 [Oscillospiraceae bacterium]|nr:hypothetical protein [Oscillospiraceae bacterium]
MQDAKIKQLFRLFACLEDAKPFYDLAEAAMMQVKDELREDADQNDIRLSYYAAALANLCYRQMIAAEASAQTYAGGVSGGKNGAAQCELAERLMLAYRKAAAPLLRDDAFVFSRII